MTFSNGYYKIFVMYNLKGNLHVTVWRSDFARKTYGKHENQPDLAFR